MKIEIVNEDFPVIGSSGLVRSPGIHLSDVIRRLRELRGMDMGGSRWEMGPTRGIGLIWEEALSHAFGFDLAPRIGEISKDGIYMTPDGFDPEDWVLHEYKATYKSSRRSLGEVAFIDWMIQIKSYCNGLDTNRAILRVLFVNGDYQHTGPCYKRYDLEFTNDELAGNWNMILRTADEIKQRECAQ